MPTKFPEKAEIALKAGKPYDSRKLRRQLKNLEKTGNKVLFETVKGQVDLFRAGGLKSLWGK